MKTNISLLCVLSLLIYGCKLPYISDYAMAQLYPPLVEGSTLYKYNTWANQYSYYRYGQEMRVVLYHDSKILSKDLYFNKTVDSMNYFSLTFLAPNYQISAGDTVIFESIKKNEDKKVIMAKKMEGIIKSYANHILQINFYKGWDHKAGIMDIIRLKESADDDRLINAKSSKLNIDLYGSLICASNLYCDSLEISTIIDREHATGEKVLDFVEMFDEPFRMHVNQYPADLFFTRND